MKNLKKSLSLVLAVLLMGMALPLNILHVLAVKTPVESIEIVSPPTKTKLIENYDGDMSTYWNSESETLEDYFLYDIVNNRQGFAMRVNYTDGTYKISSQDDNNTQDFNGEQVSFDSNQDSNPWSLGEHEVTVSYMGCTASFAVEVVENPVDHIAVTKMPDKTEYIVGYDNNVSSDGMEVTVYYKDGTSAVSKDGRFSNGLFINAFVDFSNESFLVGDNEVTVSLCGKNTTMILTGIENPVASIEVVSPPTKTQLIENNDGYWSTYWNSESGKDEDCFYYNTYNREGFALKVNYSNGTSAIYSYEENSSMFKGEYVSLDSDQNSHPWGIGEHEVTVSYMGRTTSFAVEVVKSPVESLEIVSLPKDINYVVGEVANVDGLELKISYTDGSSRITTLDSSLNKYSWSALFCTIDGYDCSFSFLNGPKAAHGTNTIKLSYLGAETSFNVEASTNSMKSFKIVTIPKDYTGEGMVIKVCNSDGSNYNLSILNTDYSQCWNEWGDYGEGGFVKTEKGVFPFSFHMNFDDNYKITKYEIGFFSEYEVGSNKLEGSVYSLPETSAGFIASYAAVAAKGYLDYLLKSGIFSNQGITYDSIDLLAHVAVCLQPHNFNLLDYSYCRKNGYECYEIPAADIVKMVGNLFAVDGAEAKLLKSPLYDSEKGVYDFIPDGYGHGPDKVIDIETNNDGNYVVTYSWDLDSPLYQKTLYVTVTPENKIKSFSETYPICKTHVDPPSAPILSSKTNTTVTLNAESGYEYSTDGVNWQNINIFTGLSPNTAYTFYQRLAETTTTYASGSSVGLTVTTHPNLPPAPSDITSPGKTETSVDLSWAAVSGATGYNVYNGSTKVNAEPVSGTTYTVTGLNKSTSYSFTVKAISQGGESAASTALVVTTTVYKTGDIISFGSYPQTKVTDLSLLSALNSCTLSADNTVSYNGEKFKRVYFEQYTAYRAEATPPNSANSNQDDNGYYTYIVYWFKYEPIQWRVLSNSNGELLVMAEKILDAQTYNQVFCNSTWETCTIRSWLNDNFYNAAFSSTEQTQINTSYVVNDDNPWQGTDGGNNTNDKLFLLSDNEVVNPGYGFSSSYNDFDTARRVQGTDFAKSKGLSVNYANPYTGNGEWWLRSQGEHTYDAGIITSRGDVYDTEDNNLTIYGVRPAFKLNICSNINAFLTSKTDTTATLAWSKIFEATGYNVYNGSTKVNATPITDTTYTVTGLTQSTSYSFTVKAVNAGLESAESTPLAVTTSTYFIIDNGIVTGYLGLGGDVIIPDGITGIGNGVFANLLSITSVSIPTGVTSIGNAAFWNCSNLKSINIPASVKSIGIAVFSGCTTLTNVYIPKSVTTIGQNAFKNCTGLGVYSVSGTYAETYAITNGLNYMNIDINAIGAAAVVDRQNGLIYGLDKGTKSLTNKIETFGGAELEFIMSDDTVFGTGSIVNIKYNGEVIKTYTVVIFGDVNGDGNIDAEDADKCVDVQNWKVNWNHDTQGYYYKAGDINGDGNVDVIDSDLISEVSNWTMHIDQTTGLAVVN